MTIVALTQRVTCSEYGERRDALDQRWNRVLEDFDLTPLSLPNRKSAALRLVREIRPKGLILTGGNDLAKWGGDAPERDETEGALLCWAEQCQIPVLGVCRGMQMMLVREGAGLQSVDGHVTPHLAVEIEGKPFVVNSYHRWKVTYAPENWSIWGKSLDGTIKAVRHQQRPWIGIMWHPEREATLTGLDREKVFSLFSTKESQRCEP